MASKTTLAFSGGDDVGGVYSVDGVNDVDSGDDVGDDVGDVDSGDGVGVVLWQTGTGLVSSTTPVGQNMTVCSFVIPP